MAKPRFLSHGQYPHGSARGDYDDVPVHLPRSSNLGMGLGLLLVIAAIAGLLAYYIM